MYNEYFGFSEAPFSIAPDPRYLFMSARHREALAHLLYGLRSDGGFVLLTGEVGTGKTTICRCLLDREPDDCDIAFVLNPKLDTVELLATLCDELHIALPAGTPGVKILVDLINRHLLAANARGRKTVLIVDEAQNLSTEVLEQLRLLTNLETNRRKLLQIILLGQPELRDRLARPDMRQLAQRIVARYHLEPLSRPEVAAYVSHRLSVAGARHALFPPASMDRLYRLSGGTPRLINLICDRALLGAYVESKAAVDPAMLARAAAEVLGPPPDAGRKRSAAGFAALALVTAAGVGLATVHRDRLPAIAPAEPTRTTTAAPAGSSGAPTVRQVPDTGVERAAERVPEAITWPDPATHWLHELAAVRALLGQWGLAAPPLGIEGACQAVRADGLACLHAEADLDLLRAINAPAIVELRQDGGPVFFATLVSLDAGRAGLAMAGTVRQVPVDSLRRQWNGKYTLLWRSPPGWYRNVGVGARGADVAWVVGRLDRWDGLPAPGSGGDLFTAGVEQRVRAFQRRHGLPDDGVIGPMTMVRLAALPDGAAPILASQAQ